MKSPFQNRTESTEDSAWAEWLSGDNSAPTTAPKPLDFSKHRKKKHAPQFSFPQNQSSQSRSPQSAIDTAKFQDEQMRAFLKKQTPSAPEHKKPSAVKKHQRKEIALSIRVPRPSVSKIKTWRLSRRAVKRLMIGFAVVLAVGFVVLTPKLIGSSDKTASESSAGGTKAIPKAFAELKPADTKNVTNVRYDASRGFYAFNDRYRGGNITVTEQQLPDNVRGDAEKGKELAQSVGATDEYETTQGMLYLTLSDTKTAQRAVLLHRQLLIFIQSTEPLAPTAWVDYVQSLQ